MNTEKIELTQKNIEGLIAMMTALVETGNYVEQVKVSALIADGYKILADLKGEEEAEEAGLDYSEAEMDCEELGNNEYIIDLIDNITIKALTTGEKLSKKTKDNLLALEHIRKSRLHS